MTLTEHLARKITTTCLAWAVERRDGQRFGFTDHDGDLEFEGLRFRADTGLTAAALQQSTGLSVDNTEALGAFSDAAITEADLRAGRFDGAEVRCWMVNWADPAERILRFRGTVGEVSHGAGGFRAELRGLAEALNKPQGRVIQSGCDAALGDGRCKVDLGQAAFRGRFTVIKVQDRLRLVLRDDDLFEAGWFVRGQCRFVGGAAAGLAGAVKADVTRGRERIVELWQEMAVLPEAGDAVDLVAGCDKAEATCRLKFSNFRNFRGFPDVPGEDWLTALPHRSAG